MKVLIAIVSCHSRPHFAEALRSTWVPLVPPTADIKFFLGRGGNREPLADEVFLDCDDSYHGLPNKVQEMMRWAYDHGYDFALKCDDDVVLKPRELLLSGFQLSDFTGCQEPSCKPGEIRTPWGFCYWLSRRAMKLVVDNPLPGQQGSVSTHVHNNDEAWVSTVLHVNQIFLHSDKRYYLFTGKPAEKIRKDNPRPLRRPQVPEKVPEPGTFAFCVYLNWAGWHMTPDSVSINEFRRIFSEL